jgi:general secretion pathway protein J
MIHRQHGFTLLEILVALVVLGFLMIALTQGVQFGLRSWDLQARTIARRGDLDAIDRTLRGLIEHMDPGSPTEALPIQGNAASLAFTTELPLAAGALSTRLADVALGVDGAHRLLLRWTPHLHAVRFGPAPPPQQTELLRGVDHLDLSYWRRASRRAAAAWLGAWTEAAPPGLVRIRLVFPEGDARHWPDIVAAPMRDRAQE